MLDFLYFIITNCFQLALLLNQSVALRMMVLDLVRGFPVSFLHCFAQWLVDGFEDSLLRLVTEIASDLVHYTFPLFRLTAELLLVQVVE